MAGSEPTDRDAARDPLAATELGPGPSPAPGPAGASPSPAPAPTPELAPTLTPELAPTAATDPGAVLARAAGAGAGNSGVSAGLPGYRVDGIIGRGGMGEVMLAHDAHLGRLVAVKRMRAAAPTAAATARFLREARIQARLDHPAVVPVYQLGHDRDGLPFFAMKRLAGTTLAEVLAGGRASRQRLLRALVDVTRAVDFAHSRGVVHRDLKPANIILGDYGEVYVLDWGVARLVDPGDGIDAELVPARSGDLHDGATGHGDVIGTPGYMAPEQVRGEEVGPPADVYALGATLFELLTGQALHPRGEAGLAATLLGEPTSAAARAPAADVPPELDELCAAAVQTEPALRPSARQVADAIERYLDGDRDAAMRRAQAEAHLAAARAALAGADDAGRARAMQEAGRALALDRGQTAAADLITRLLLEPPARVPAEVATIIARGDRALGQRQSRFAIVGLFAYSSMVPFLLWAGVRSGWWLGAACLAVLVQMAASWVDLRWPSAATRWTVVVLSASSLMVLSRLLGPFVIAPALTVATCVSLLSYPALLNRPASVLAVVLAGAGAPLLLEASGLWASTWSLQGGMLVSRSAMLELSGAPAVVAVLVLHAALVVGTALYTRQLALARREAHVQLELRAWHLRQLVS